MELRFAFKHMEASDAVRFYAEKRSAHFKKYLHAKIKVDWNFVVEHGNHIAHCHITSQNIEFFGEAESLDMNTAIDTVVEKVEKQLKKHKELVTSRH